MLLVHAEIGKECETHHSGAFKQQQAHDRQVSAAGK
jgi:hypothetical protein